MGASASHGPERHPRTGAAPAATAARGVAPTGTRRSPDEHLDREAAWSASGTRTRSAWGTDPVVRQSVPFRCVLHGELDFTTRDRLLDVARTFEASASLTAEIDVSDVTFVDSSALAMLLSMRRTATERGGAVVLVEPGRRLRRLLALAGVSELFAVQPLAVRPGA